ncbi:hypothetical protein [Paenibacillus polymyxa]|uniref:hypothetical protein n=1 Tax=Paenibacillus polymyxa TaxID=1406 RepID=UPI003217A7BA
MRRLRKVADRSIHVKGSVDVASELASKGSQTIESAIHQMSAVSNNVSEILMEGVIDIYALNLVSSNYTISA